MPTTARQQRRSRQKDDLRRKILDAATALFVEEGYEHVSMRKIADRIEYAPSTIYLHFRDKADLVAQICIDAFTELDRRLDSIAADADRPLETLRRRLRRYIDFALDQPACYVFVFCTPARAFKAIDAATIDAVNGCAMGSVARLRTAIEDCLDRGALAGGDLESLVQSTWLLTHGVASGLVVDSGFPFIERERLIEESLDRIVAGLVRIRSLPPG